jgi:hypothetical protein
MGVTDARLFDARISALGDNSCDLHLILAAGTLSRLISFAKFDRHAVRLRVYLNLRIMRKLRDARVKIRK